jgi:YD repeat-containing protein
MPEGATLDPGTGAFSWTPGPSQTGDYSVQFSVTDGELAATQSVVLRATINPVLPQVIIVLTPSFPAKPGQSVLVHVAASSLAPITGLSLTIAGQSVPLDSQGRATYTPQAPGRIAVSATGTDADGLVGQFSTVLKVVDPTDLTAPVVAFDPRLANAKLSAAAAIVGTISDTNLDSWVLDQAPLGSSTYTTLASGNTPVSSATLATFDPTVVANGPYVLRLTATDIAGRTSQATIVVEADSTTKPTQYLRTETDLSVVLAGSVFNLVRSYDSLTAGQSGTFGYGWSLASEDTDIQTTVLPTGHEATGIYNPFLIGTRVYLTLPSGQRVGFTFTPVKEQINGLTYYMPAYTADSGVTYTLNSAGGPLIQAGNRYNDLKTGLAYNPASDLYPGPEYTLTGPDGTVYDLSTAKGVQEIDRPDGTKLFFADSGITASTGESIQFVRDAEGRITSIIAPDGTTVVYTYDSSGNLVSARNLTAGQSSRYGYQAGPVHLLTEAVSPSSGTSAAIKYGPPVQVLPITADLGSSGEFLTTNQSGTLAAGGTDRYAFSFRPSEIQATASGEIYLGISVQAAPGSLLQPAVPSIAGLTPLLSHTTANGAFALFAITQAGLERLDISGANGSTSGAYTVHMDVAGDVNGDATVDGVDAQLLAGAMGTSVGQPGYLAGADANQDGVINAADAQLLASDLGFQPSQPPVATAGQALTHQDLAATVDLTSLATDPAGDPIYFRVLNPQDGTATLSSDGHTVVFVPAPGYTGPASFQYQADDGYGTSAPATVQVTVSSAVLVGLDFQQTQPRLTPGQIFQVVVVGEFADGFTSVLPASYYTLQTNSPAIASVTASGQLTAVADGATVLTVSSHGIEAATAVTVGVPTDPTQQSLYALGLDVYPAAVSLPSIGGVRQIDVSLDEQVDLSTAASGTSYYVSNPNVISVTADGLVTSVAPGDATVTVINGSAQSIVHVHVVAPHVGPTTIGIMGGVVSGSDGSLVQIAPGALSSPTNVSITPVSQANLPIPVPSWLSFVAAENLQVGDNLLAVPAQVAIPMPGVPAGTTVYIYGAGSLPDNNGIQPRMALGNP